MFLVDSGLRWYSSHVTIPVPALSLEYIYFKEKIAWTHLNLLTIHPIMGGEYQNV